MEKMTYLTSELVFKFSCLCLKSQRLLLTKFIMCVSVFFQMFLGTLTMRTMGSLALLLKAFLMMSTACWCVTPCRDTPSTDTNSNPAWGGVSETENYVTYSNTFNKNLATVVRKLICYLTNIDGQNLYF